MSLYDLPNELILCIAEFLNDESFINAILQTCRRFSSLLSRPLYEFNVRESGACALEWAAKNGYPSTAQKTLEAGGSPNAARWEDWLPMALACIHGNLDVVRVLMDYGVDLSSTCDWVRHWSENMGSLDFHFNSSPLTLAAECGHENIVRHLISHGVPPNIRSEAFITFHAQLSSLDAAAKGGHLAIAQFLISVSGDAHIKEWYGSNSIVHAASEGHYEVVRLLLGTGLKTESPSEFNLALTHAAEKGDAKMVDLFLEHLTTLVPTPSSPFCPVSPLTAAVQNEHYAVVEKLRRFVDLETLIKESEPNDENQSQILLISAACGWQDLIELLLQSGGYIDSRRFRVPDDIFWTFNEKLSGSGPEALSYDFAEPSPLALAAHHGRRETVEFLLNHEIKLYGEECLSDGEFEAPTPLFCAIDGSQEEIMKILLKRGANPNGLIDNRVPLLYKAVCGTPDLVKILIDYGANPEAETDYSHWSYQSESSFTRALRAGNLDTATFLLRKFSFPDCPINRRFPFISYVEAAAEGGVSVMRLILDHDGFQVTPGSYAVQQALRKVLSNSDTATLALLIERGLCAVSIDDKPILALVDSLRGDVAAMAATIDMLIAHGISVENEDTSNSALYQSALSFELGSLLTKMDLCRLLLDRGADALRIGSEYPATPLAIASRVGNKELVKMMLRSLEGRIIPLEKLEWNISCAEDSAESGLTPVKWDGDWERTQSKNDVRPLLRRFYWRAIRRYEKMSKSGEEEPVRAS